MKEHITQAHIGRRICVQMRTASERGHRTVGFLWGNIEKVEGTEIHLGAVRMLTEDDDEVDGSDEKIDLNDRNVIHVTFAGKGK